MDREEYERAKKRLEEVTRILKYENISVPEREKLEKEGRELAKVMMTPWIPFDWSYRIIIIFIIAVGFWGLTQGMYFLMLLWLLLPLFSPRIVGKFLISITGFRDS
jgi:hypothetical protein